MPYRRTERVVERTKQQRAAILDSAVTLLAERGYAGCSVATVAAGADVATGTVYRHFSSKAELAVELFRRVVRHEVDMVASAADQPTEPADKVLAIVATFANRALKVPRLAYALLAEPVDPAVDTERLRFRRAFAELAARHIAAGVRSGSLPAQHAEATAAGLIGAVAEVLVGPLTAGGGTPDPVPELIRFTSRAIGSTN